MRKPVLFIAYQFPPQAGPGVHRSLRFTRFLPDYAIDPVVITRDRESLVFGKYMIDEPLLDQVPSSVRIVRVQANEQLKLRKWLMKFKLYGLCWFLFYRWLNDPSRSWAKKAEKAAEMEIQANNIKIIYTSSAPFSSLRLGYRLKKRFGVKWVADLRDPWTDAFTWAWPSLWHWKRDVRREFKYLSAADKIIVVTEEMRDLLLNKGIKSSENIIVIHNGF